MQQQRQPPPQSAAQSRRQLLLSEISSYNSQSLTAQLLSILQSSIYSKTYTEKPDPFVLYAYKHLQCSYPTTPQCNRPQCVVPRLIAPRRRHVLAANYRDSGGRRSNLAPLHQLHLPLHRAFPEDGGRREKRDAKRQHGVDCLIHGFDEYAFPLFCLESAYNQLHADIYDNLQAFCPSPNMLLSFLLGKRI